MEQRDELTAVTTYDNDTAIVRVSGEIDIATCDTLTAATRQAVAGGAVRLVLDLSAVTFMDSSGLAVLIRTRTLAPVTLKGLSEAVARLLETTGLTGTLHIEP